MFEFITDEALRTQAIAEYEQNVLGLKTNAEAILNEKKKIQEKLATFDNIDDPAAAAEALKFLRENAEARLIQEGKFEEVIEKRVSQVKQDSMAKVEELTTKLAVIEQEGSIYKNKYNSKIIEDELRNAALTAGVRPEALTDVLLRGRMEFALAEDGVSIEARDSKGNLRKNDAGLILSPSVWLEGLKSTAPHYWPQSEGAGFVGGKISANETMAKLQELLDKGDQVGYRKLRKQLTGK